MEQTVAREKKYTWKANPYGASIYLNSDPYTFRNAGLMGWEMFNARAWKDLTDLVDKVEEFHTKDAKGKFFASLFHGGSVGIKKTLAGMKSYMYRKLMVDNWLVFSIGDEDMDTDFDPDKPPDTGKTEETKDAAS